MTSINSSVDKSDKAPVNTPPRSRLDYMKHRDTILTRKSNHYRDVEGPRRRAERKAGKEAREKEAERKALEQAGGSHARAQELLAIRKRKNESRKRRHEEKKKAASTASSSS